ncbi:hypothetical protein BASA84_001754 [Batrachochytrium salamandrivorans]|nr:hypothetical protein BASA84_001754 [Batrachochytrium salamandrivorans]
MNPTVGFVFGSALGTTPGFLLGSALGPTVGFLLGSTAGFLLGPTTGYPRSVVDSHFRRIEGNAFQRLVSSVGALYDLDSRTLDCSALSLTTGNTAALTVTMAVMDAMKTVVNCMTK